MFRILIWLIASLFLARNIYPAEASCHLPANISSQRVVQEANAVLCFDGRSVENGGLFSRLQDEIFFGLDLTDPLDRILRNAGLSPPDSDSRLIIVKHGIGDRSEIVVISEGDVPSALFASQPGEIRDVPGSEGTSLLRLGDGSWFAVGGRTALELLTAQAIRSGRLETVSASGTAIWGHYIPDRAGVSEQDLARADIRGRSLSRSLTRLESVSLAASFSENAEFSFAVAGQDGEDSKILAIAMHSFFDPFRDPSNSAPSAVREATQGAQIDVDGNRVELSMTFSMQALDALRHNQASRRLLSLDWGGASRERRERLSDIVDRLDLTGGERVADIGSGAGFHSVRLARAVGGDGRVYSVDIQDSVLDRLRRLASAIPLENLEVIHGATDDPNLPPGQLDAALIVNAYHEMTEFPAMLEHIRQALKPGGRFVLVEPFEPSSRNDPRDAQVKKHRIAPELVETELTEAGFEVIERDDDFMPDESRSSLIVARKPLQNHDRAGN